MNFTIPDHSAPGLVDAVHELINFVVQRIPLVKKIQYVADVDDPMLSLFRTLGAVREGYFRMAGRRGAEPVDRESLAIYTAEAIADGPKN